MSVSRLPDVLAIDVWTRRTDPAVRNALIVQYLDYASALAARAYARRGSDEIDYEDYLQWARVGLLESIDRYDPGRGASFSTFAFTRIQGAILNGLSIATELQQQVAFKRHLVSQRRQSLREIAQEEGEPQERNLIDTLADLADVAVGLALGFILEDSGMIERPQASIPDYAFSQLAIRQMQSKVRRCLELLKPQEQTVLRAHYFQQERFEEIGQRMNVTKGRVSQIHKSGVEHLRKLLRDDLVGGFDA